MLILGSVSPRTYCYRAQKKISLFLLPTYCTLQQATHFVCFIYCDIHVIRPLTYLLTQLLTYLLGLSLRSMAVLLGRAQERRSGEISARSARERAKREARENERRSREKNNFSSCFRPNLLAVSLPSPAFITQRAQPKPPCYAGQLGLYFVSQCVCLFVFFCF